MLEAFKKSGVQKSKSPKVQLVLVGKIDKNEPEVMETIKKINNSLRHPVPSSRHSERNEESVNNRHPEPNSVIPAKAGIQTESSEYGLQTAGYDPAILAVGFVDEADLPYLYAGALAYIIPSLSEGFGLPPLEAMACGTPVISSDVSAMPEILGDAPLYFDPYSVDSIAKAMSKVVSDEKLRNQLSKKGLKQAKKYSWAETGRGTLEVYKEVLGL